jgi:hypothetical protein
MAGSAKLLPPVEGARRAPVAVAEPHADATWLVRQLMHGW